MGGALALTFCASRVPPGCCEVTFTTQTARSSGGSFLGPQQEWVLSLGRPVGTAASTAVNLTTIARLGKRICGHIAKCAENEKTVVRTDKHRSRILHRKKQARGLYGSGPRWPIRLQGPQNSPDFSCSPCSRCGPELFWVLNSGLSASPGCCMAGPAGQPGYLGVSPAIMTHCYLVPISYLYLSKLNEITI